MFTHTTLTTLEKSTQLYEAKAQDRIPMCPREHLVFISISTGLSFAKKGLGHLLRLFFITCTLFCCLIKKPLKIPFAKYLQRVPAPYHYSAPSAPRWDQHSYLSKVLRYIPYTCGSSVPPPDLKLTSHAQTWKKLWCLLDFRG